MRYQMLTRNGRGQVVNATQDLEEDGFLEVLLVVHPYNHVVNSVIVARVKERPATGPEVVL
jgi:hypothetical protein